MYLPTIDSAIYKDENCPPISGFSTFGQWPTFFRSDLFSSLTYAVWINTVKLRWTFMYSSGNLQYTDCWAHFSRHCCLPVRCWFASSVCCCHFSQRAGEPAHVRPATTRLRSDCLSPQSRLPQPGTAATGDPAGYPGSRPVSFCWQSKWVTSQSYMNAQRKPDMGIMDVWTAAPVAVVKSVRTQGFLFRRLGVQIYTCRYLPWNSTLLG